MRHTWRAAATELPFTAVIERRGKPFACGQLHEVALEVTNAVGYFSAASGFVVQKQTLFGLYDFKSGGSKKNHKRGKKNRQPT